ncbi:MAG: hypothetical protein ABIR70_16760 [Bryobacteraceae bacterium]
MDRLTKFASKLYPRWWRERYGEEFTALLEEARPGFRGALDIAKAAFALQLTTYSWKRVVFAGALGGVIVSTLVALSITPQYASTGRVVLLVRDTPENAPRIIGNAFRPLAERTLSRGQLADIISNLNLYPDERMRRSGEDVLEMMKQSISISLETRATNSATVAIRFEYREPRKAMLATHALVVAFQQANRARPDGETVPIVSMQTKLPGVAFIPNRSKIVLTGLELGLAVGSGLAAILHFRRRRKSANLASVSPSPE